MPRRGRRASGLLADLATRYSAVQMSRSGGPPDRPSPGEVPKVPIPEVTPPPLDLPAVSRMVPTFTRLVLRGGVRCAKDLLRALMRVAEKRRRHG